MDPLREFRDALRNPLTRRYYERRLSKFFDFLGLPGDLENQAKVFAERARDPPYLRESIYSFILAERERVERKEITAATLRNFVKAIKLFCEENELFFNWKKLTKRLPPARNHANDRAPTREEIQRLLEYPDYRVKPVILILASSGVRIGAFDYFRVGDLTPVMREGRLVAGRLVVYRGEPEEYFTFVTPEAFTAVKEYLDFRREHGEHITDDSPLIRDDFDVNTANGAAIPPPRRLRAAGVKALLERAMKAYGLSRRREGNRRREWQTAHGYRKYFKTVLETMGVKSLIVEKLMGHSVGLADSYFKPTEEEMLEEYLKATPKLSFYSQAKEDDDELMRLKERVERLERENREIRKKAERLVEVTEKIRRHLGFNQSYKFS